MLNHNLNKIIKQDSIDCENGNFILAGRFFSNPNYWSLRSKFDVAFKNLKHITWTVQQILL